jgi:hypothetical protein
MDAGDDVDLTAAPRGPGWLIATCPDCGAKPGEDCTESHRVWGLIPYRGQYHHARLVKAARAMYRRGGHD